jgi:hypothetical protein
MAKNKFNSDHVENDGIKVKFLDASQDLEISEDHVMRSSGASRNTVKSINDTVDQDATNA